MVSLAARVNTVLLSADYLFVLLCAAAAVTLVCLHECCLCGRRCVSRCTYLIRFSCLEQVGQAAVSRRE